MKEQDKNLDRILSEIRHRIALNDKEREGARKRGEEYNIFKILGGQYSELAHSAFIADLLDPKGSHSLGSAPLGLLLEILNVSQWDDADINNAEVNIEVAIEGKSEDEWGRMDIVIKSNNKIIIIENKIYAGDQPKQLSRYKTFAKNYADHTLIYLTLDGHPASYSSTKGLCIGTDYLTASYQYHIHNWISDCIKLAAQKPLVREVLIQYQNVISELTTNNSDSDEKKAVYDYILQNGEILTPVFTDNSNPAEKKLIEDYCESDFFQYGLLDLMNKLSEYASDKGLTCNFGDVLDGGRYCAFSFQREDWTKTITFQFTQPYWKGCYYGVYSKSQVEPGEKMPHLKTKPNDHYCFGDSYTNYKNWDIRGLITGEIKKSIIHALELTLDAINKNPDKFPM